MLMLQNTSKSIAQILEHRSSEEEKGYFMYFLTLVLTIYFITTDIWVQIYPANVYLVLVLLNFFCVEIKLMRVLTFHSSGWVQLNFCPLTKVLKVFKTLATFSNQNVFNEKSLGNGTPLIFELEALQFEEYVVSEKKEKNTGYNRGRNIDDCVTCFFKGGQNMSKLNKVL